MCDCDEVAFAVATAGKFNNDAMISGNVAANEPGGWFRVSKDVFMADGTFIAADNVELGNASSVFHVYANQLKKGFDAVIRDGQSPITLPLQTPFCVAPTFTCGGPDVIVGPGEVLPPLTPGTYGRLIVRNGASLPLAYGTFTFCDVKMGRQAQIVAQGTVIMNIVGNLRVGTASFFGPDFGYAPIQAFVLGRKVRTSQSAVITAKIVAPNAKMTFGRDAAYNGCFCTAQAKSDKHITLTCVE